MRVKLISAKLRTGFVPEKTKPDKRYKSGYRVISEGYSTYIIHLTTTNPRGELRIGQTVRAPWGNFRVVSTNFLPLDGEVNMIQLQSMYQGNDFEFNAEFDLLPLAFAIGEGSI